MAVDIRASPVRRLIAPVVVGCAVVGLFVALDANRPGMATWWGLLLGGIAAAALLLQTWRWRITIREESIVVRTPFGQHNVGPGATVRKTWDGLLVEPGEPGAPRFHINIGLFRKADRRKIVAALQQGVSKADR